MKVKEEAELRAVPIKSVYTYMYIHRLQYCTVYMYQRDVHVECVYCTEPKATCRQCKNQPNAYNMYTDFEGILSACLYLHVSFYSGVVHFCR